jgi:hypothetical protein
LTKWMPRSLLLICQNHRIKVVKILDRIRSDRRQVSRIELIETMKTIVIQPNEVCEGIANFSIEYRFKKIRAVDGGPACQRFMRLTEIPVFKASHIQPQKTVWHEIYSEDLSATRHFKKWLKQIGKRFFWKGNIRDLCELTSIMSGG